MDELDKVEDVYIEPPDVNNLTDEDSGAEDGGYCLHPENLSGNQLLAPAEFRASRNDDDREEVQDHGVKRRKVTQLSKKIKWRKDEGNPKSSVFFPEADSSEYRDFSFVEIFELFFLMKKYSQ